MAQQLGEFYFRDPSSHIYGLPLSYPYLVDPEGRAFNKMTNCSIPVINIMAGRFNRREWYNIFYRTIVNNLPIPGLPDMDMRRFVWEDAYYDHISYLRTMAEAVYFQMMNSDPSTGGSVNTDDFVKLFIPGGQENQFTYLEEFASSTVMGNIINKYEMANIDVMKRTRELMKTNGIDLMNTGNSQQVYKAAGQEATDTTADTKDKASIENYKKMQLRASKRSDEILTMNQAAVKKLGGEFDGATADLRKIGGTDAFKYFNMQTIKKKMSTHGFMFFMDEASSVSETISNQYGSSQFEEESKSKAQQIRQNEWSADQGGRVHNFMKTLSNLGTSFKERFTGANTREDTAAILSGYELTFPKMWKEHEFSKNYNISFTFTSPYGDPHSIFMYVYYPLLILLTLSLPVNGNTPESYAAPFILRVDAPGLLVSDAAVIRDLSFTRGGSSHDFTETGLPLSMQVTLSIEDLYSSLIMARDHQELNRNGTTANYLSNLAGINVENAGTDLRTGWRKVTSRLKSYQSRFLDIHNLINGEIKPMFDVLIK